MLIVNARRTGLYLLFVESLHREPRNTVDPTFVSAGMRSLAETARRQFFCSHGYSHAGWHQHAHVPGYGLLQPKAGYATVPGYPAHPTSVRHPVLSGLQLLQQAGHAGVPTEPCGILGRLQVEET